MDNTENKIKNFSEWAENSLTNRCESKENPFDKSFHFVLWVTAAVFVCTLVGWGIVLYSDFDLWRILVGVAVSVVVDLSCLFVLLRLSKMKATFDEKIFDFDQKLKDTAYHKYLDYRQKQLEKELAKNADK